MKFHSTQIIGKISHYGIFTYSKITIWLLLFFMALPLFSQVSEREITHANYDMQCEDILQTSDGGYIATGSAKLKSATINESRVFLSKYTSTGTLSWTKLYGYPERTNGGVSVQKVLNAKGGSTVGYIIAGSGTGSCACMQRALLIRTNLSGDTVWTRFYGDECSTLGRDVIQTFHSTGAPTGFALIGRSCTETGIGSGQFDLYALKVDANGNSQWAKKYGSSTANGDEGYSLIQNSAGNLVLCGSTSNYGAGADDIWLLEVSTSTGALSQSKVYGGNGGEWGTCVRQTSDGGYIVTGSTDSYPTATTGASNNIFLMKVNNSFAITWFVNYENKSTSYMTGPGLEVRQTSNGDYAIAGVTTDSTSSFLLFLMRADSNGNARWLRSYRDLSFTGGYAIGGAKIGFEETTSNGFVIAGHRSSNTTMYMVNTDPDGYTGCNANLSYEYAFQNPSSSNVNITPLNYGARTLCTLNVSTITPQTTTVCTMESSQFSGRKFRDNNANGIMDVGESPLAGWEIRARNVNTGVTIIAFTDPAGYYNFTGLPSGTWILYEIQQSGWTQTAPHSVYYTINSIPNAMGLNLNFGNLEICASPSQRISNSGIVDTFDLNNSAAEQSSPSSTLLSYMNSIYSAGVSTQYDDPRMNVIFGHTFNWSFSGNNCYITGAKLILRIRALGFESNNDRIGLVQNGQGIWSSDISSLVGLPWNVAGTTATVTLDLSALPGGTLTTILAALQDGNLDFYIQDDTQIDYAKLELDYCCIPAPVLPPATRSKGEQTTDVNTSITNIVAESFPNPFQSSTVIRYTLTEQLPVVISIFTVNGEKVAEFNLGNQSAGVHEIQWNALDASGKQMPEGPYFYRIEAGSLGAKGNMILQR